MIYNNQNIGRQHKGDSEFVAKCRLLQSIYRVEIGEDETTGELWDRLSGIGARLLTKVVTDISNGIIENIF